MDFTNVPGDNLVLDVVYPGFYVFWIEANGGGLLYRGSTAVGDPAGFLSLIDFSGSSGVEKSAVLWLNPGEKIRFQNYVVSPSVPVHVFGSRFAANEL